MASTVGEVVLVEDELQEQGQSCMKWRSARALAGEAKA